MSNNNGSFKSEASIREMIAKEEKEFEVIIQQANAALAQQQQKVTAQQEILSQIVEQGKEIVHTHRARIALLKELIGDDEPKIEALPPESATEG